MRTQEEITKKMSEAEEAFGDYFGFSREVLIEYLGLEHAKPFLNTEALKAFEEDPTKVWTYQEPTKENLVKDMAEYMERVGWDKAINHRGISASRTIIKLKAWLWLLEDGETLSFLNNDRNYPSYGAPMLKKVCEVYSLPIPEGEEIANMMAGKPCSDDCGGCRG